MISAGSFSATNITATGKLTAVTLATSGGNSSQFLKGDGSLDGTAYLTSSGAVTSITGTINQITASSSNGAVTLALPTTISNITSITATGMISAGSFSATNITATGTISAASFSGTLSTGTLQSITSVGTLSNLTATNINVNSTITAKTYVATLTSITPAAGTSPTIDLSQGNLIVINAPNGGNVTLSFTNQRVGTYILKIVNNTNAATIIWPGAILWSGNTQPVLTGNGKVDIVSLICDGSNFYGTFATNF